MAQIDRHLDDLYATVLLYYSSVDSALSKIDPAHEDRLNLDNLAGWPRAYFRADENYMRTNMAYRRSTYETLDILHGNAQLDALKTAGAAELDFLAFVETRRAFSPPENNEAEIEGSKSRLSDMMVLIDKVHEPDTEVTNTEDEINWLQERRNHSFSALSRRHFLLLRKGDVASHKTVHDFLKTKTAGEYLNAAYKFIQPAQRHLAMLVLEKQDRAAASDPYADLEDYLRRLHHEKDCAKTLIELAVKAYPLLDYINNPRSDERYDNRGSGQNGNGGFKPN